jgi:DNA-binding XRE family transcriptional regulator
VSAAAARARRPPAPTWRPGGFLALAADYRGPALAVRALCPGPHARLYNARAAELDALAPTSPQARDVLAFRLARRELWSGVERIALAPEPAEDLGRGRTWTAQPSGVPMSQPPTPTDALALAMAAFREAVAEVERAAGGPAEARPVFLLDARTLRNRAPSDRLAALELARREARATLHRAAEAAALAEAPAAPVVVAPRSPERAPAPAREAAPEEPRPWWVRLREWREAAGLNQRDAAAKLGTGKSTWSTWELGTSGPPKPDTIAKLSALTGIPAAAFLAGEGGARG